METDSWNLPGTVTAGRYVAGMVTEFIVFGIMLLLVFSSIKKYLLKRNITALKVTFVFCGLAVSTFLTGLGKLLVVSGTYDYTVVEYTFFIDAFSIMSMMISNTAFYLFTLDVFYQLETRKNKIAILVYLALEFIILSLGIYLWIAYRGKNPAEFIGLNTFLMVLLFSLSLFTYLLLAAKAFRVSRKATGFDRVSMRMIGWSAVLVIAFFFLFAVDVLNLLGIGNISVPYFLALSTAVIAILITYIGYFRPGWFQKRYSSEIPD